MRKSLENCAVESDIHLFVSMKKTGSDRPGNFKLLPATVNNNDVRVLPLQRYQRHVSRWSRLNAVLQTEGKKLLLYLFFVLSYNKGLPSYWNSPQHSLRSWSEIYASINGRNIRSWWPSIAQLPFNVWFSVLSKNFPLLTCGNMITCTPKVFAKNNDFFLELGCSACLWRHVVAKDVYFTDYLSSNR